MRPSAYNKGGHGVIALKAIFEQLLNVKLFSQLKIILIKKYQNVKECIRMNYNYGLPNNLQNSLQTLLQNQANGLIPNNSLPPLSMVAVSGIDGAKAFQTQPNSAVPLFDNSKDILYIKTTDGANFPTIKTFKLVPYDEQEETKAAFVSRTEFEEFKTEMKSAIKGTKKAKGKDDEE